MKTLKRDLESSLESKIKSYIKQEYPKALIYKTNVFGMPDILILLNGKFIAYEVKRANQRAKPHQLVMIEKINSNGGYAVVVDSFDKFLSHWNKINN